MTNPIARESRQYIRIPFDADVLLKIQDLTIKVHLLDISLKGAMLQYDSDSHFQLHERCRLELPVDGGGIAMDGQIVHLDVPLIGFESQHIELSSLGRLCRLIESNCGDAELMHREIRQLFRG